MPGVWDELGIAPTKDASAVKRAYARRLKIVRPDADPEGFARLRKAYERALASAQTASSSPSSGQTAPQAGPDRVTAFAGAAGTQPAPVTLPAASPAADMGAFLQRGDVLAAASSLIAARAAGMLTLAADLHLADQLGWAMAQDLALPAEAVRSAAGRLGWPEGITANWAGALRARLDAEGWLQKLRRDAASRKRWLGYASPLVARTLLGRGRRPILSQFLVNDSRLARCYGEYLLHAGVVSGHFDPVRVESVGRLVTRKHGIVSDLMIIFAFLFIAWVMAMAATDGNPDLQNTVTGAAILLFLAVLAIRRVRSWSRKIIARLNRL